MIQVIPVAGVPEVTAGDDLACLLHRALDPTPLERGDVLVVTQKVVSKAEGRFVSVEEKQEAVERETVKMLRRRGELSITETRHGFVCANAGVDASNVPGDRVTLLPLDADASARRLRGRLRHLAGVDVAVVISDTFGRAWRVGQTDVAIGVAGIRPFADYIGSPDTDGKIMTATRICVADELAAAGELAMGKTKGVCAAIVRGAEVEFARGSAAEIARAPDTDLFR